MYVHGEYRGTIRKHRALQARTAFLVDGGIVKKLVDHGVTGISFGNVYARLKNKKRELMARDQILVSHMMPPMSPRLSVLDEKTRCPACQRGGFYGKTENPGRCAYRKKDLEGIQDFNHSWEFFGEHLKADKNGPAKYPVQLDLVTPKVMNIFRDAGVNTFLWHPVLVDED